MSESYSHSQGDVQQEYEYSPELSNIPQTVTYEERSIENLNSYIRISGREEKIDEQGILEEFHNKRSEEQRRNSRNSRAIGKKVKIEKLPQPVSKKYDFVYIKKKWKAQIQSNIQKYKQYLKQQKQGYDFKQKEFMLDFFKILLDGIFQLKDYGQSQYNDLTNNERKIIASDSDQFAWLRDIVNSFDREFKEAKYNGKIESTGDKWKLLIKNCKDESNFELRRKIIRMKVKPVHVIMNKSEFLMSEQAKLQAERLRKLILAEADKNFQKPIDQEEQPQQISDDNDQIIYNTVPQQLESIRSMSVNENLERRIFQQREKLEEYKQFIEERQAMLRNRIEELLKGTSSYKRILENFLQTFY